jgi:hypothetical protein
LSFWPFLSPPNRTVVTKIVTKRPVTEAAAGIFRHE